MKRERTEYELAVAKLKRLLKAQKITYRDLAAGLRLSESGIKKTMGARDGSFQRLVDIARFTGVSVQALLEESEADTLDVAFSERQQALFLSQPKVFEAFWRLLYEREAVPDWEMRVGKKEAFRILRLLDSHGFLQLLPGGRVRIPHVRSVRWTGDGPFVRKLYQEWSHRMLNELALPGEAKAGFFLFRYFRMEKKTYEELLQAQRNLEREFLARAIREMQADKPGLQHVRWMAALDNRSFLTD